MSSARPPVDVTVLVCTRDRPEALERCLRSVLACDPPAAEVVVVDQSRGPDSRRVVEGFGGQVVLVPDPRSGLSLAQNLGFATARSAVVLVTDDDCEVPPDWVGVAAACFVDERVGMVGGRVLPLGPDEPGLLPVSTRTDAAHAVLDDRSTPWQVGSGNNFAVRRSVILAVGGNDERLGPGARWSGGADMDLFRRVLRSGVAGVYLPDLVVLHERATIADRLARRIPYGFGMGACVVLWWRQGDRAALRLLVAWLRLRAGRLTDGLRHADWLRVREEVLVLIGTVRGAVAALRGPAGPVSSLRG